MSCYGEKSSKKESERKNGGRLLVNNPLGAYLPGEGGRIGRRRRKEGRESRRNV
jgi:hypothetical protein